eukprot:m.78261 g.78261  ORF g.78261 m.78261 type:complete len:235 (+) comp11948_c0_seq2:122-826(+)
MSSQRIETLKLTPSQRKKLEGKGFSILSDFDGLTVPSLCQEIGVSMTEAAQIMEVVRNAQGGSSIQWAPVSEDAQCVPITTLVRAFDELLGGGIETRRITEICGAPGAGKTQFSIQMAVNCQMPEENGGLNCSAVYIDTEGSFMAQRLKDMAESVVGEVKYRRKGKHKQEEKWKSVDEMLECVHVFRVHNQVELIAVINTLAAYCHDHKEVIACVCVCNDVVVSIFHHCVFVYL